MKRHPKREKRRSKPSREKSLGAIQAPLSPRRKWLFRLTALVIMPLLLVILLGGLTEISLRLAGYGYDTSFFRPVQIDGRKYLLSNEKFCQRFFPPQLIRWPDPFKMAAVKPPDTIRIFIFGESAAMGDPQPAYGAGRYMEMLLRKRFPGKKIEVVNLGITAINSHVILPVARECARYQGDFWIVYMGNNEMVGPFGAATVFGARALPRSAVRFNLAIQEARTGQLLVSELRKLGGKSKTTSWGGMEMFLENQIAPGDPRKETVYANFESNLHDIVSAGLDSGAKVILSTMSVNLRDCPPFASYTDSNLPAADLQRFNQIFSEGKAFQSQYNFAAAAQCFTDAVKLEPRFAEAYFRLGQCELALTNHDALAQFQAACDLDALPFRADTRINSIIGQTGKDHVGNHLVLADAEKGLAQDGLQGIAGDESFYEHVHFNFNGNYRLGKIWAEQIVEALPATGITTATNWITQNDCEQLLALSIWNRQFVLQSVIRRFNAPPLSTQFNNSDRLQAVRAEESTLRELQTRPGAVQHVRDDYTAALKEASEDPYLYEGEANFFEAVQDPAAAITAYRQVLQLRPDHFYACLELGRLLGEQQKPDEGQNFLERATQLRPSLPDAWFELGNVLSTRSKFSEALDCMERAAALRPQDSSYTRSCGEILAKLGRHPDAMESYRKAIRIDSGDWEAHFELAGELAAVNQASEAMNEYAAAIKINPNDVVSHINLGVVLVRFNRFDEAIVCFQEALKLDPGNQVAQEYLASVLSHKNNHP